MPLPNGSLQEPPPVPYSKGSPEYHQMHTRLGLLAIAVIINVLGFSVVIPLVPYYIRAALGSAVNPFDPHIGQIAGWLTAVYALMQFFFAPIWGRLSDKIVRKPILIGSLCGDVIFYTMFGLSHSLVWLFTARILAGIFSSATLAVAQAYAADVTPPEHRAVGLGMIGASFGVGFVFGPALGGLLGGHNLGLPLFVAAGFAFVNLLFIWKYLPEPPRHEATDQTADTKSTSRLATMVRVVTSPIGFLYILTFAVTFAFSNFEGTFTSYLMQHFGFTRMNSTAVQGGVFTYVGPMIPIAVGSGLNSPAIRALISRKSAATNQGATLGISASFDSLARATGPAAGGWLYAHVSEAAPYWCAGIVMAVAFLFAVLNYGPMQIADPVGLNMAPVESDAVGKT